jgi:hypothetical protein
MTRWLNCTSANPSQGNTTTHPAPKFFQIDRVPLSFRSYFKKNQPPINKGWFRVTHS